MGITAMEEAVANGILKAASILGACYLISMAGLAVLKFVDRNLVVFMVLGGVAGATTWAIKSQTFGPMTAEYVIVWPLLGLMGLGALWWLYEVLMKIEAHWDKALEARRCRKMASKAPWTLRSPAANAVKEQPDI